jgi:hypothetical protein
MASPTRLLPRSRRAGHPGNEAMRQAGSAAAARRRATSLAGGQGLERDMRAMAVVARMLRRGAGRWLKTMAGSP